MDLVCGSWWILARRPQTEEARTHTYIHIYIYMVPHPCVDSLVHTLLNTSLKVKENLTPALILHAYVCRIGLNVGDTVGNRLVWMLLEASSFFDAHIVFEHLKYRYDHLLNSLLFALMNCDHVISHNACISKAGPFFLTKGPTFVALLKSCSYTRNANLGSQLHTIIAKHKVLLSDLFLCNSLVDMYAKCGFIAKAKDVFEEISAPDVVSWNALVGGYGKHQYYEESLKCFEQMQVEGVFPNAITFVCSLKAVANIGYACKGIEIHAKIVRTSLHKINLLVGNALVDMYAKCGLCVQAQQLFDELPSRDVVSWNALIAGYVKHGNGVEALLCFDQMQIEKIQPTIITLTCALKACAIIEALGMGRTIHALIHGEELLAKSPLIGIALVAMYAKCGMLDEAYSVLNKLDGRDTISWTTLMAGYVKQGYAEQAINCFERMQLEGVSPNAATYVCGLKAYAVIGASDKGIKLHEELTEEGWLEKDIVIGNSVIDMYANCGLFQKAQEVFDRIQYRDVVSWTALMSGYVKHNHGELALSCLRQMESEGTCPNEVSFVCALKACGIIQDLDKGKNIQVKIATMGMFENNIAVGNALLDMYVKCNCIVKANEIFDLLPVRDVVSWTTLIAGYVVKEAGEEALGCFEHMQLEGISPNVVTYVCSLQACGILRHIDKGSELHGEIMRIGLLERDLIGNSLVDMYAKCGELAKAQETFDSLMVQNVVSWTSLIAGYTNHDYAENALACFDEMQSKGITPNSVTFICILKACGSIQAIDKGIQIHDQIRSLNVLEKDVVVGSALVDMYAKLGFLEKAEDVFEQITSQDTMVWNTLISGYAEYDYGKEVLNCFEQMKLEGVSPDAITFVLCLKACGTMGAKEKGLEIHSEISRKGILGNDIVVGNALIGMYAKCGLIAQAQEVFDRLPVQDVVTWSTLISGYGHLGECETVFGIFEKMKVEGRKPDFITFVSILNACNQSLLIDKGHSLFESIKEDYDTTLTIEHHTCMVGLLGQAGHLESALEMVKEMPLWPDTGVWHCLLDACSKWGNFELGKTAFEKAMQLDDKDAASYLRILRIYADAEFFQKGAT